MPSTPRSLVRLKRGGVGAEERLADLDAEQRPCARRQHRRVRSAKRGGRRRPRRCRARRPRDRHRGAGHQTVAVSSTGPSYCPAPRPRRRTARAGSPSRATDRAPSAGRGPRAARSSRPRRLVGELAGQPQAEQVGYERDRARPARPRHCRPRQELEDRVDRHRLDARARDTAPRAVTRACARVITRRYAPSR